MNPADQELLEGCVVGEPAPNSVPEPPTTPSPTALRAGSQLEQDRQMAGMKSEPRNTLWCLLMLLECPRWMSGLWCGEQMVDGCIKHVEGGWLNHRSAEVFVSFAEAQQWLDERIAELGLDADLVNAYPKSHQTLAEDQAFYKLPFAERMKRFVRQEQP